MFHEVEKFFLELSKSYVEIFASYEDTDFCKDEWSSAIGSGITSVLEEGNVFEKVGVGFSSIQSNSLPAVALGRHSELDGKPFKVCGVSLIAHPFNPHIPTTHANFRYFECGDTRWFGGGFDLTPFLVHVDDFKHWHAVAKRECDKTDNNLYALYKEACDSYFYLKHRRETRGVGGLFIEDCWLGSFEKTFQLVKNLSKGFVEAYFPIVERRKQETFTKCEKDFQLYRRGRYTEFNLLYDRGTLFGLQSNGRVESIFMSLPPISTYKYSLPDNFKSLNQNLLQVLRPINWEYYGDVQKKEKII